MILAILQARTSSTRLPGKVLKPIIGRPMLAHQIERVKRSKLIDKLVVATSQDVSDDPLASLCAMIDVECYRGSLEDVLDRFYQAAKSIDPDHVVRLTGDCPLADPELIDEIIQFYLDGNYDYASNTIKPTYPDGLDAEVCRFSALESAWREAKLPSQREHVTPFINRNAELFKLGSYESEQDLSHLRWTVDEPEDFEFVTRVYEALAPEKAQFGTSEILDLMNREPRLEKINSTFERNEGLEKSLAEDRKYATNEG